ncbi:uncharacterized protein BX663DRAFT_529043 [Cokeromyces recurvatus]|uniref:uncharacterized protein n=1 Tax=Cokeromyces recurvatus TaxID=90255 RepID=UPI00221F0E1F|nr:uncharacterized protein BX663DRAFT_529043 [Cokeromyces recurvatus]KAI7907330.1 hypothetical protein BX663DRAFT_529043 [Cokeromyces recurvatus]
MYHNKITSLPVFSHNNTEIVSIVNLFDILLYLVQGNSIEKEKLKLDEPVENVLGLDTDRESYRIHKVDCKDKLIETLRAFASGKHRALVVNFDDELKNPWILSQTDIIRHIVKYPDSVSNILDLNCRVQDLENLVSEKQLITATDLERALDVYHLMAEENLSAVPVINKNNEFEGDLCVEDLPGANLEHIEQLTLTCKEYIKITSDYLTPSVATSDTTLKEIIDIMIKQDTHRVWILDSKESRKVTSVITMSDIMGLLCLYHKPSLF